MAQVVVRNLTANKIAVPLLGVLLERYETKTLNGIDITPLKTSRALSDLIVRAMLQVEIKQDPEIRDELEKEPFDGEQQDQIDALGVEVGELDARVTTAEASVGALDARVTTAEASIGSLDTRVGVAEADIATTQGEVATNQTDILAVDTRVTTAEGNITTNASGVSTNAGDITALDGRVTTTEGDVTGLDTRVTTNEGAVTGLDGRVTTNEGDITSLSSQLGAFTGFINFRILDLDGTTGMAQGIGASGSTGVISVTAVDPDSPLTQQTLGRIRRIGGAWQAFEHLTANTNPIQKASQINFVVAVGSTFTVNSGDVTVTPDGQTPIPLLLNTPLVLTGPSSGSSYAWSYWVDPLGRVYLGMLQQPLGNFVYQWTYAEGLGSGAL